MKQFLRTFTGMQLTFNAESQWSDTLQNSTSPKIIVIVDSTDCTVCSMELRNWYLQKMDLSVLKLHSDVIFILNERTTIDAELDNTLQEFKFQYILDPDRQFVTENNLPKNPVFHTFLLDRNNRVVLVGSPIGNPKMWSLYKETIQKLAASGGQLSGNP